MSDEFSLDQKPVSLDEIDGFKTGVAGCGLLDQGNDIGVLYCEGDKGSGTAALSRNAVASASVRVSSPRAAAGGLRAIVLNAGAANCCTGEDGYRVARGMIESAAAKLELTQDRIIVASTGAIGRAIDLDKTVEGIEKACAQALETGNGDLSAILAPDGSGPRTASGSGTIEGTPYKVAGVANAASLVADDAPSRILILATDAAVKPACLRELVRGIAANTLGRWYVDSGSGTNDMLCVLCSGTAGNEPLEVPLAAESLRDGLEAVAKELVVDLAFKGEKGVRLIEVFVSGAASDDDAEAIAKAIASSVPVRIAMHLSAPRWGLILAAAGKAGARVVESRATLRISGETVFDHGKGIQEPTEILAEKLREPKIEVALDLGIGESSATVWTSDLSDGEKNRVRRFEDRLEAEDVRRRAMEQKIEELEVIAKEVKGLRTQVEFSEKSIANAGKMQAEREELEAKLKSSEEGREAALKSAKSLRMQIEIAESKLKKLQSGS